MPIVAKERTESEKKAWDSGYRLGVAVGIMCAYIPFILRWWLG